MVSGLFGFSTRSQGIEYKYWKTFRLPSKNYGALDLRFQWYPKFYNHVIIFVGTKSYLILIEFWLVGSNQVVSELFDQYFLSTEGVIFIIIGYILRFIVNCLIPQDPEFTFFVCIWALSFLISCVWPYVCRNSKL